MYTLMYTQMYALMYASYCSQWETVYIHLSSPSRLKKDHLEFRLEFKLGSIKKMFLAIELDEGRDIWH